MNKRLKTCLVLNTILSFIGIFVAMHLVQLHYKNPQHQKNLSDKHPQMSSLMVAMGIYKYVKNNNDDPNDALSTNAPENYNPYKNIITEETLKEQKNGFIPKETCDITEELSCSKVDESKHSEIWGIAVALYGLSGNILFTMLTLLLLVRGRSQMDALSLIQYVGGYLGFGFVIYLTSLETFVIHSYCPYCLVSAGLMTCCFICNLVGFGKNPFKFIKRSYEKKYA